MKIEIKYIELKTIIPIILILLLEGCSMHLKNIKVQMKNESKMKNVEIKISTNREKLSYNFISTNYEHDTIWTLRAKDDMDGDYKLEIRNSAGVIAEEKFGYYTNGYIEMEDFSVVITDSNAVYSYSERNNIHSKDTLHYNEKGQKLSNNHEPK